MNHAGCLAAATCCALGSAVPAHRGRRKPTLGLIAANTLCVQGGSPEDAIWVVLRWEGLAPLSLYPAAQQTSGIGLGRLFGGQEGPLRDRTRMLRCVWGGWGGGGGDGEHQRFTDKQRSQLSCTFSAPAWQLRLPLC